MDDLETPPPQAEAEAAPEPEAEPEQPAVSMDELLSAREPQAAEALEDTQIKAVIEAIVYVADEPLTLAQLASALQQPAERIRTLLDQLVAEFDKPEHGITIREVAGGFKMATKAEHHDAVRAFVKSLKPPLKLSLPALETLAVIAYKQPVTSPEIMEIRGVQGAGVLKTLLDRKLIAGAGRKNVIGKPILYKTTKEFLIQFGLKDLSELPSLKEFEEIRRMALEDGGPSGARGQGPGAEDDEPVTEAVSPTQNPERRTPGPDPAPDDEPVTEAASPAPGPRPLTPGDPATEAESPSPDAEPASEAEEH
jgi:segregation and condensation protein B